MGRGRRHSTSTSSDRSAHRRSRPVVRTKGRFTRSCSTTWSRSASADLFGKVGKACRCLRRKSDRRSVDRRTRARFGSARQTRHDVIGEAPENRRVVRLMTIPRIGRSSHRPSSPRSAIFFGSRREEVQLLFRIDAEGSPIWRSPCAPRTDQQQEHARPQRCLSRRRGSRRRRQVR